MLVRIIYESLLFAVCMGLLKYILYTQINDLSTVCFQAISSQRSVIVRRMFDVSTKPIQISKEVTQSTLSSFL